MRLSLCANTTKCVAQCQIGVKQAPQRARPMLQQLQQTFRSLRRAPTFTLVAVITLSLGIGATTSVLSIVDGVLLKALPYKDVRRLAMVFEQADAKNARLPSYLAFKDLQASVHQSPNGPVEGMVFLRGTGALLRIDAVAERTIGWWTSPQFFSLMGAQPLRGRVFQEADNVPSANHVAVISYRFWQKRFAGDSSAIGRVVNLDSSPTTIIGVMPREFEYPGYADFWIPIAHIEATDIALQQRGMHVDSRTIARLRSDGDSAKAATALSVVAAQLARTYPDEAGKFAKVALRPISNEVFGEIQPTLLLLAGAAALVLLLGCVNVATLSLVRASVRAREMAVRAALGATRSRLVKELFVEGAMLSLIGTVGGLLLAFGIVRAVRQWAAVDLPRAAQLGIDGRFLVVACCVSVFAMIATSLVPAWRASKLAVGPQLHGGLRGAAGTRGDSRIRGALVSLQFGFAVLLLVGAGLLIQSFRRLSTVEFGYDENKLLTMAVFPPTPAYDTPQQALVLFDRLREAVKAVPGVSEAALVNHAPGGGIPSKIDIPGRTIDASQQSVLYRTASQDYLKTLGARMKSGRWFNDEDIRSPESGAVVINETVAKRFWPNGDAIGQAITMHRASSGRPNVGEPLPGHVIGVVADMHSYGKDSPVPAEAWVPYTREVWTWVTVLARADNPRAVAAGIRKAVLNVEPNIPMDDAGPTGGVSIPERSSSLDRRELALAMVSAFAVCALVLAAIGLYGVVAYTVTQRTREVGIRMALGATQSGIAQLVLGGALKLVAIGTVVGLACAFAGTRVIVSLLFNTAPTDVATYIGVPVVLLLTAVFASWWPARRAVRIEPTVAMRGE